VFTGILEILTVYSGENDVDCLDSSRSERWDNEWHRTGQK